MRYFILGLIVLAALATVAFMVPDDPIPKRIGSLWCELDPLVLEECPDAPEGPHAKIYCYPHWGDPPHDPVAIMSIEVKNDEGSWSEPVGQMLNSQNNLEENEGAYVLYMLPLEGWEKVKVTLDVYCPWCGHVQDVEEVSLPL